MVYRRLFIVCLSISIFAFSCGKIEVNPNIKYRVSGSVTNIDGMPLENVKVSLIETNGLQLKCTITQGNGIFDFVTSDATGRGSVLEVNFIDSQNLINDCNQTDYTELDSKWYFFTDESYVDYEIEFDVTLEQAIPLHLTKANEDSLTYQIHHDGVTELSEFDGEYWLQMRSVDTVTHFIKPNQGVRLVSENPEIDTILEVGEEEVYFKFTD